MTSLHTLRGAKRAEACVYKINHKKKKKEKWFARMSSGRGQKKRKDHRSTVQMAKCSLLSAQQLEDGKDQQVDTKGFYSN